MTIITQSKAGMPQPGLDAAREGRSFHCYADDITPGASETTLTDETLVHNVPAGYRTIISQIVFGVNSVDDDCEFRLASCSGAGATGTATQLNVHRHVASGAAFISQEMVVHEIVPNICVKYKDGARSISFVVNANDPATVITVGFSGWDELDTDIN